VHTNLEELKKGFGEEYPAAMMLDGIRLPLDRESRFMRHYHSHEHKMASSFSRFADGSASITASELQREWGNWTEDLQMDFCYSCYFLFGQSDFPEMLRYIMEHGGHKHWCAVALQIVYHLPSDEAFDFLVRALRSMNMVNTSNITQAIAETKRPDAKPVLRNHLAALWTQSALWDNVDFMNWMAHDATTCISHLVKLGAPPSDFTEQARQLSGHACSCNRAKCRQYLSKYYPEISFPN
jgi:hypothetical protein